MLKLIKEVVHPENKMKSSDMVTDKPGKFIANDGAHGAYTPSSDPKENLINQFLHDVAKCINNDRAKNSFNRLIVIAPPSVEGILMQYLDKHVKSLIICSVQKDLIHANEKDLLKALENTPNY